MNYVLYFSRGGKEKLENVSSVKQNRKKITFIFTDGLELVVMKQYLLHYELIEDKANVNEESIQDPCVHTLKCFDDFLNDFVYKVENGHLGDTIAFKRLASGNGKFHRGF
ncbi:MAG: hypothetical protein KAX49_00750 [Halanaerobiales bacterium]|nr:hypothetical protein [Halanaerobiales bacterium]